MPRRASKKTYTLEEKARLVGEIECMYRTGGRTYHRSPGQVLMPKQFKAQRAAETG